MKMRARKRYHDAWQVGRELFRLNQRLLAQLRREVTLYPAHLHHDDMVDFAGFIEEQRSAITQAFGVPRHMLRDQGKSRIEFWSGCAGKTLRPAPVPADRVWVDEATGLRMSLR